MSSPQVDLLSSLLPVAHVTFWDPLVEPQQQHVETGRYPANFSPTYPKFSAYRLSTQCINRAGTMLVFFVPLLHEFAGAGIQGSLRACYFGGFQGTSKSVQVLLVV